MSKLLAIVILFASACIAEGVTRDEFIHDTSDVSLSKDAGKDE